MYLRSPIKIRFSMVMLFFGVVLVFFFISAILEIRMISTFCCLHVSDGACPIVNSPKMERIAAAKTNHPQKGDQNL